MISGSNADLGTKRGDFTYQYSVPAPDGDTVNVDEKIDGKTAILFAAPSGTGRDSGKIFVGLVQDDGKLDWIYNYSIRNCNYRK